MRQNKIQKKYKDVEIIIKPSEETVDFVSFVDRVLKYEMAKIGRFAGLVVLEKPKDKPEGSEESK